MSWRALCFRISIFHRLEQGFTDFVLVNRSSGPYGFCNDYLLCH